jgi:hypothetical protein
MSCGPRGISFGVFMRPQCLLRSKVFFLDHRPVANFALHVDNPQYPHVQLLLTTRNLTADGFGLKRRDWNTKTELLEWRQQWAKVGNEHTARVGLDLKIDHRTLEAQGICLVAGRTLGLSAERPCRATWPSGSSSSRGSPRRMVGGPLESPGLALQTHTHTQATFTGRNIAKYLQGRTDGAEHFQAAYLKVQWLATVHTTEADGLRACSRSASGYPPATAGTRGTAHRVADGRRGASRRLAAHAGLHPQ